MNAPHRFALARDCSCCTLREKTAFCHLPSETLACFTDIGYLSVFPADVSLLNEGELPRGMFILCSGRAKLWTRGEDGKPIILAVAGARQILGLSAVVLGQPSAVTVTTVEHSQVKFLEREAFLGLLACDGWLAQKCAAALSRDIGRAFDTLHELLLARNSVSKLAKLLLSLAGPDSGNRDVHVDSDFTHEEMAQMIGSSRETVTRLLCDMKRRELIRQEGATLVIPNRIALQAITA